MMTNGLQSSEFWVAVISMIVSGFLVYEGKMSVQESITFASIPSAYILSRGFAKTEAVPPVGK